MFSYLFNYSLCYNFRGRPLSTHTPCVCPLRICTACVTMFVLRMISICSQTYTLDIKHNSFLYSLRYHVFCTYLCIVLATHQYTPSSQPLLWRKEGRKEGRERGSKEGRFEHLKETHALKIHFRNSKQSNMHNSDTCTKRYKYTFQTKQQAQNTYIRNQKHTSMHRGRRLQRQLLNIYVYLFIYLSIYLFFSPLRK